MSLLRLHLSSDATVWLSWIQGITTLVLAVLTGIYVKLTARVADAAVRQAEAGSRQAEAATQATRLVKQQIDVATLEAFVPIQSAVATALAQVRACKVIPMIVPLKLEPPNFANAVEASERLGASMAGVMRAAQMLLSQAQTHKNDLAIAAEKSEPSHIQVKFNLGFLETRLDALEEILQALYDEITPTVEALRTSPGRTDITLASLKPRETEDTA